MAAIHLLRNVKIDGVDHDGDRTYDESIFPGGAVESLLANGWAVRPDQVSDGSSDSEKVADKPATAKKPSPARKR